MINIGDRKIVKASSANNTYHKFNGCEVEIIGMSETKSSDPLYNIVYTFHNKELGFGAMYAHGFE